MSRVLRLLVGAAALVLLVPAAATADRWAGDDAAGDVTGSHYDPEPAPCGTDTEVDGTGETTNDITGLAVRHTRRAVVVTTRFRDLDPDLELMLTQYLRTPRGGFWLDVVRFQRQNGGWRTFTILAKEPRYPDPEDHDECGAFGYSSFDIGCRVSREINPVADLVRMSVPRTCVKSPKWVRVGADAVRFVESDVPEDESFTVFSDEWEGGTVLTPWKISYGPRAYSSGVVGPSGDMDPVSNRAGARRFLVVGGARIFARR